MTAPRVAALAAAVLLNAALALQAPTPAIAWIHPVAPPLTHIPEMGEAVLADAAPSAASASVDTNAPTASVGANAPTTPAAARPGAGTPPRSPPHGAPPPGPPPQAGPGGPPRGPPPMRGLAGALARVVAATGTPEQRAAVDALRGADTRVFPHARRAHALRLAVQADAVALAEALGPARVGLVLAHKDELSTRVGEGRAWSAAIERLK